MRESDGDHFVGVRLKEDVFTLVHERTLSYWFE